MKTTTKYNKSEIMKEAWSMFNDKLFRSIYKNFAGCLKAAWSTAKEMVNEAIVNSLFSAKRMTMNARYGNKITYQVRDEEGFNNLYIKLRGTFAAKVMMTIAKVQEGIATERQIEIITNSL